MARARLKNTGVARKGKQPTCRVCGNAISPGEQRFEWSFRYGGTYHQHAFHGAPRLFQLTQGQVGELYAAQEAVEDVLASQPQAVEDFYDWRSQASDALMDGYNVATDLASRYEEAAENFGGGGENADRAASCEAWADQLADAASEVEDVEVDAPDAEEFADCEDPEQELEDAVAVALSDAIDNVVGIAEGATQNLEL